jgi:OFA family oxalate/formate antiporter-like MFS transporter
MTTRDRQGWFIVATMFVVLLLVFGGGYNTVPVFVPGLLRAFPNWSHQRVSILPSVLAASAGLSILPVGWLVDRVEARVVMVFGALAAGSSFLIASQSNSLAPMIAAYLLLGVGIAAGTVLPASLVIANWFAARRGIAMGIANAGSTTGGMVMTLVAGYAIRNWGWRAAYLTLGIPMIVVVIPLVLIMVRSRPPGEVKLTVAQAADRLEGFEATSALATRSFWMIVVAQFCFAFAATGTLIHMASHLEGLGYSSANAALAISLIFGFAALGKVIMGFVADRVTARVALALTFAIQAIGVAMVFIIGHAGLIALFVLVYGLSVAAPLMLLPLVIAESMGLKRFGFISGITGLAQTLGAAVGPLVAGKIFDVTRSFAPAFELMIVVNVIAALAILACRSYEAESSRPPATMPATASA